MEDTSREAHAYSEHLIYRKAGLDDQLATALYGLIGTAGFHPPYPDARGVLQTLKRAAYSIGVVSDIHTDLREHADAFGIAHLIDAWSLSWEQGIQKPDPRMFLSAIEQLGIEQLGSDPARTVMVGDRAVVDGAAADLGVTCLILPAPSRQTTPLQARGLSRVLDLVGLPHDIAS